MNLERWVEKQRIHAAAMMRQSISPAITKTRERFFQTIKPKPGSVVASPVLASYDPDPDYFFHWFRDSAVVMDALRLAPDVIPEGPGLFADFLLFSLDLQRQDGRTYSAPKAEPDFVKFLRSDLSKAYGSAIGSETRVNPDGTLDITGWPRPQHDGPALRALAILNWGVPGDEAAALLTSDLQYVIDHARHSCFGIWEEEKGLHYYVLLVSAWARHRKQRFAGTKQKRFSLPWKNGGCTRRDSYALISWINLAQKRNWTCR
jgi:glucoamylase